MRLYIYMISLLNVYLDSMPRDVGVEIFKFLSMVDIYQYSKCSQDAKDFLHNVLRTRAATFLQEYGLKFTDVRLMQAATKTVISGSTIPYLLDGGTGWLPGDLDFFTGRDMGDFVVLFLSVAGKYAEMSDRSGYLLSEGIGRIWTLENDGDKKINVVESASSNPLDAIMHFHSTCVMGAWTADELWHAYPELTMKSCSLVTPSTLPLRPTVDNHQHAWAILDKYTQRGFTFRLGENPYPHKCGEDFNCPATLRSSSDDGCLTIPFPLWQYTNENEPYRENCWTLGGVGCRHGHIRAKGDTKILPFNELYREFFFLSCMMSFTICVQVKIGVELSGTTRTMFLNRLQFLQL